jgi:hypothetical protein
VEEGKEVGVVEEAGVMHANFMHELCCLLFHIPTYLHVMRCYNHVLH